MYQQMTNKDLRNLETIVSLLKVLASSGEVATDMAELYKNVKLSQQSFVRQRIALAACQSVKGFGATAFELINEAIQYLVQEIGGPDLLSSKLVCIEGEKQSVTIAKQYKVWTELLGTASEVIAFHKENLE
jgi:hypothetical protein